MSAVVPGFETYAPTTFGAYVSLPSGSVFHRRAAFNSKRRGKKFAPVNKRKNVVTNTGNYFSGELESSETSGANKGETAAPNRFFAKTKQAAFVFGSIFLFLYLQYEPF